MEARGVETVLLDVANAASIAVAREEVDRRTDGKGIDVLVNNAGYGLPGPIETLDLDAVRAQFETNVFGLIATTQAFLPRMRERRSGRIVNVASILGHMTIPFLGAYCATKYAVESISDALRLELAPFGIRVVMVEPGTVKTGFAEPLDGMGEAVKGTPYEPFASGVLEVNRQSYSIAGTPEEIAAVIERAAIARRPRARYVAPFRWRVALCLFTSTPTWIADAMLARSGKLTPATLDAWRPAL